MRTVAVVGVGLIGGSFALALRRAGFDGSIVGVSSPDTLRLAKERGAIDEGLPLADAVAAADLVYLAQPVGAILTTLSNLGPLLRPGALVTDAGSTKRAIVRHAAASLPPGCFLGGHPMAGKERRGVGVADPALFQDRTYLLCPPDGQDLPSSTDTFIAWLRRMGARPVWLSAEEHDRTVALSSHLPQLVSTGLGRLLHDATDVPSLALCAGPGLKDMLRLAESPHSVWADILATNADQIDGAINALVETLRHFQRELRTDRLREDFQFAQETAQQLRALRSSTE